MRSWFDCALLPAILMVSLHAYGSADIKSAWQGDWRWDANSQSGIEYGGHLIITDCNETGCNYDLYTGSDRAVCNSDGRFSFRSHSSAVHELEGEDFLGKKSACSITFEIKDKNILMTDADGGGCSYFCGLNASFGADFHRVSKTPLYRTSFNCLRAQRPLEKTICSDKGLARLDLDLSQRYRELQTTISPPAQRRLRLQQQQWLRTRDQTCGSAAVMDTCLKDSYLQRIDELKAWNPGTGRKDAEIQSVFENNKKKLFLIYRTALRENPALQGKIVLKLTILPSGEVTRASVVSSNMNDGPFEHKFLEAVEGINFGTKDAPAVTIQYPVKFVPTAND